MASTQKQKVSTRIPRDQFDRLRRAAQEASYDSRDAYFERVGLPNFTKRRREQEREKERREKLDNQIKQAIKKRTVPIRKEEGQFTRVQAAILIAIIDIVKASAVLFASEASIAKAAKVSRNSVTSAVDWLEDELVLVRQRSGGLNMETRERTTNKYRISYEVLRYMLGLEEIPTKSCYEIGMMLQITEISKTPFWSSRGFCRFSNSERAQRRRRQREDERNRLRHEQLRVLDEVAREVRHRTIGSKPVEKPITIDMFPVVEIRFDRVFDQQFCALSLSRCKEIYRRPLTSSSKWRPIRKSSRFKSKLTRLTYFTGTLFHDLPPNDAEFSDKPTKIDSPKRRQ